MHTSAFKLLAAGVTGVALALGGFGLYAVTAADPPTAAPLLVAAPPAPAEKGWTAEHVFTYKSPVTAVAFGPDIVAAGDKDGVLILWDAKAGKEKEKLLAGADGAKPIDRLQFTPDGAFVCLVTNGGDNIHQCSVEEKGRIFPGTGLGGKAKAYGVTADGAYWLEASGNRTLILVTNRLGENMLIGDAEAQFRHKDVIDFAAAGDADLIGTISGGMLRRWDKAKDKPIWEEKLEQFEVAVLRVPAQQGVRGGREERRDARVCRSHGQGTRDAQGAHGRRDRDRLQPGWQAGGHRQRG